MSIKKPIEDVLQISVSLPTQILVASDIHLSAQSTAASRNVEVELSKRIALLTQASSAVIVFNGDVFELWAGEKPTIYKALLAHKQLTQSLENYSNNPKHQVIFVVGNHDGRIGWSSDEQEILRKKFNAKIGFSAEVIIKTPRGERTILFEHGHMLDPDNAFEDPRDPHDKPFGQYIVQTALPMVTQTQGNLLEGIEHLSEPHKFAKFVASRVLYREIFSRLWWLLIPLAITLLARVLIGYGLYSSDGYSLQSIAKIILYTEIAIIINVLAILLAVYFIMRNLLKRAKTMPGASTGVNHNSKAREKAKQATSTDEVIGYITGHTHHDEVTKLENGFYANSGCGTEMVEETKTRFALPSSYVSINHLSWLELELSQDNCTVSLWQSLTDNHKQTSLEKIATKKSLHDKLLAIKKTIIVGY
ncbi:metallophosphoesterase [Candidatus Saccharibacteria bacterium]|nr:metallophosphoesterase [Candidatus Saccharibacteria bacterium]